MVDPGPLDEGHLAAVAATRPTSRPSSLTHGHPDHREGVARFLELCRARRCGSPPTADRARAHDGFGHARHCHPGPHRATRSASSVGVGDERVVLTGDTILGRGTTVVAYPDGDLGDYLESLRRLLELLGPLPVLPGHGPALSTAPRRPRSTCEHRLARLEQVRAAVAAGAAQPHAEVVAARLRRRRPRAVAGGRVVGTGATGLPRPRPHNPMRRPRNRRTTGRGWNRSEQAMTCPVCGTVTVPGARFCHTCGVALPAAAACRPPSGGSSPSCSATCPTSPRGPRASTRNGSVRSPTGCSPRWPAR